jgi:hypothetical protein
MATNYDNQRGFYENVKLDANGYLLVTGISTGTGVTGPAGTSGSSGSSGVNGSDGTSGTSPSASGPLTSSVQTTNGATTSIATLTMGTYSTFSVEAVVSAYDSTNDLAYGSQLFAVFMNDGDSITQVGTTDVYEKTGFSTATSHIYSNGNIDIAVFGEVSKTINWIVNYSLTKI